MAQASQQKDFANEINQFRSVDTKDSPVTMADDLVPILINYMPIGTSLYTVPGFSTSALGTTPAGTTIIRLWPMNISGTLYWLAACSDGSLYKFDGSWTRTTVAAAGTFTGDSTGPRFAQWKYTNALIIDPKGYWDYDGTTLTKHTTLSAPAAGTCIAIFQSRVWTASGRTITFSAPDSFTDFTTGSSGGTVIDNYASLATQINNLAATQDYLYVVGDHATHAIFGVQIYSTGSTIFNLTDAVPGVGSIYADTIQILGDSVFMMGDMGINAVSAGGFNLLSPFLDGIYPNINISFSPVGFFTKIYNKLVYCVLVKVLSLIDGQSQKWFMCFYENRWFFVYYGSSVDFVCASQQLSSSNTAAFAAYGNNIVQIFNGTSSILERRVRTKAFNFGTPIYDKQVLWLGATITNNTGLISPIVAIMSAIGSGNADAETGQCSVTFTPNIVSWINNSSATALWQNNSSQTVVWTTPYSDMLGMQECDGRGKRIQIDFDETSSATYVLNGLMVSGQYGTDR